VAARPRPEFAAKSKTARRFVTLRIHSRPPLTTSESSLTTSESSRSEERRKFRQGSWIFGLHALRGGGGGTQHSNDKSSGGAWFTGACRCVCRARTCMCAVARTSCMASMSSSATLCMLCVCARVRVRVRVRACVCVCVCSYIYIHIYICKVIYTPQVLRGPSGPSAGRLIQLPLSSRRHVL
jgi:hypothetical protein